LKRTKEMPVKVQTGPAPAVGSELYAQGISNIPTNEVEAKTVEAPKAVSASEAPKKEVTKK